MTDAEKAAQEAEAAKAAEAAAAEAAAKTAAAKAGADDAAALRAQLEKERAERKAANAEAAKHRKQLREIQEKSLAEAGKHKELADARGKELEELRAEAEQLRTFKAEREQRETEERARREAQVAAEFDKLPEALRQEIGADADPRTKAAAIATYRAATGQKPHVPSPTAPRPAGEAGKRTFTEDELESMTFAERQALKGEIDAAVREGRVKTRAF